MEKLRKEMEEPSQEVISRYDGYFEIKKDAIPNLFQQERKKEKAGR